MTQMQGFLGAVGRLPWTHWVRQVQGVLRLEVRRNLLGKRAFFVYLLAAAPVLVLGIRTLIDIPEQAMRSLGGVSVLYAVIFRTFFLRLALFFGCVGVFMRLFRGDILERTLHFYFLAPIRREVLLCGKYLSGVIVIALIFGLSVVGSYLLLFVPSGAAAFEEFVLKGPGAGHLAVYLGVTVLASVGYGAVFLLMGLLFRNPFIPAAAVLGWESINFLLPPLLKKLSVIYYLESLCPVPIPDGPVTILAEPAPVWLAVPGLLAVTSLALVIAGLRVRYMEITYSED